LTPEGSIPRARHNGEGLGSFAVGSGVVDLEDRDGQRSVAETPTRGKGVTEITVAFSSGVGLGLIPFIFVLSGGSISLLQWLPAGNLFDDQARSTLNGRLDVSSSVAGIEAFRVGQKSYLYFGPFPALLRLPIVAVTDRYDGRLGQLSVLLAWLVFAIAVTVAFRQIRWFAVGDRRPSRFELVLAGGLGFVLTGGSIVAYLAYRPGVHHEAIMWGVCGAVASSASLLCHLRSDRSRSLVAASTFATVALLSRVTLGLAAALPLVALAVLSQTDAGSRLCGLRRPPRLPRTLVAATVPLSLFVGVQLAKFGAIDVHPSQQVANAGDPFLSSYIKANGDRYFSPRFVPTNALAMIAWPTAVELSHDFPWLRPSPRPTSPEVGHPVMFPRGWTGSLVGTQTALTALAVPGVAAVFRRRRPRVPPGHSTAALRVLRLPILCAAGAFVLTLAYAYEYQRLLADAVPALFLASAAGAVVVVQWRPRHPRLKDVAVSALAVAGLWTTWVNLATGLLDQTIYAWAPPPASLERLLSLQVATGTRLHGIHLAIGESFPAQPRPGDLIVIGECAALYMATGGASSAVGWTAVERGPMFERDVAIDARLLTPGQQVELAKAGLSPTATLLVERPLSGKPVLVYVGPDGQRQAERLPLALSDLHITLDPLWQAIAIDTGGGTAVIAGWWGDPLPPSLDAGDTSGFVVRDTHPTPDLCSRVATAPP
jgi:hypothetical protein